MCLLAEFHFQKTYIYIYRLPPLPPTSRAALEITPSASWAVALHSCAGMSINFRAKAGAGGLKLCSLWHPMADNRGPYKKITDQICSILPWLPEAGVACLQHPALAAGGMSPPGLLCKQEHPFEGPGGGRGAQGFAAWWPLWDGTVAPIRR